MDFSSNANFFPTFGTGTAGSLRFLDYTLTFDADPDLGTNIQAGVFFTEY